MIAFPHERRLLIIDDDPTVCDAVQTIGRRAGFQVRATAHADEFFCLVANWAPTHVVLDLIMPEVDGIEILQRLARRKCPARVIVTSGLGPRVAEAARTVGKEKGLAVVGVLPKPFSSKRLRALLHSGNPGSGDPASSEAESSLEASLPSFTDGEIAAAIEAKRFVVHYQPKIDCATGRLAGFEALVRWNHPEAGLILPDSFIPQAESNALIDGITEQVVEQALEWLGKHFPDSDLDLSLNLSARTVEDQALAGRLSELCWRYGVAPGRVVLELTETSAMTRPTDALEVLTRFRIKGFQLSIDDFGVGYSSLGQLARLPFTELKIDRSFVASARTSEESQKIVAAIIGLARHLGMRVTAEGVEEEWALSFLTEFGCHLAQGYHISPPLPAPLAVEWARRQCNRST